MGTGNLLLQIESREEIFADKLIAFALRQNRLKNRDLWDIAWLTQQGIQLPVDLVLKKIFDHKQEPSIFTDKLQARKEELSTDPLLEKAFQEEMRRFLPANIVKNSIDSEKFWGYIKQIVIDACDSLDRKQSNSFKL